MNLLDGLKVEYVKNGNTLYKGIIVQTTIIKTPKYYTGDYVFLIAVLTEEGKIHVKPSHYFRFNEKDLKKLRKKAPEIAKKLSRFEIMDI